jgi:hypothetical protein
VSFWILLEELRGLWDLCRLGASELVLANGISLLVALTAGHMCEDRQRRGQKSCISTMDYRCKRMALHRV